MKRIILAMAIALVTTAAGAAETSAPAGRGAIASAPSGQLNVAQRQEILAQLQGRFEQAASARGKRGAEPNTKFAKLLMQAESDNVLAAAEMPTFDTALGALLGQQLESESMTRAVANAGSGSPKLLGDVAADLVYTPLPTGRCRVADSRVINSPTPAAVVRQIDVEEISSYIAQGGNGSTAGDGSTLCGLPIFATSYAISVTVLPVGQDGFFKIFENGRPFSEGNTLLYTGAVGAANDVIVKSCRTCVNELSVYSNTPTHYVIDIVGYFMPPQSTALTCEDTTLTTTSVLAGADANLGANVCPAGTTATATNCQANWGMPIVFQSNGVCSARNTTAATQTLRASRTCCRVPGR